MREISFADRVAIVTGGGGALGRAYALELARRGAAVIVNDLGGSVDGVGTSSEPAQTVADEICALGGIALASRDTVSTPDGGEAIVAQALSAFGRVDIVISNAGILRDRTLAKLLWTDLDAVLDVHLRGAFYVSRPALQAMRDQNYGRFVFTSSNAGQFGNFGQSVYGAAKSGLVGLSNVLAIEGSRYGITSNVICPMAKTRMTEEVLGDLASQLGPEKVAPLVAFLASEACEITHEVFSAGGGHFARLFTGLSPGWQAGESALTVEDVVEHLDEIRNLEGYSVPLSSQDELNALKVILTRKETLTGGPNL